MKFGYLKTIYVYGLNLMQFTYKCNSQIDSSETTS